MYGYAPTSPTLVLKKKHVTMYNLPILVSSTCGHHTTVDGSIYYTNFNTDKANLMSCMEDTVIPDAGLLFSKKRDLRMYNFVLIG